MGNDNVVLRFSDVTFLYGEHRPILDEASFSVRNGSKIALMGQNGAGKTTLFKLITGELQPRHRRGIFTTPKETTIGVAKQVVAPEHKDLTVREFFATTFAQVPYNLDKRIATVQDAVNLKTDLKKKVQAYSGGELARLLLAYALIQDPDLLLLDEPTNNLDQEGIDHLTGFLMMYEKTVLVISHDAEFLNAFTDGVLYLDVHTQKVEQYQGNYWNVVEEIAERTSRERMQNARAEMEIRKKKEQAEVFAHKGGKLRSVAKRMREAAEEAEESIVEVRREDRTIREFTIPMQEFPYDFNGKILDITQVGIMKDGKHVTKELNLTLRKGTHALLAGPNGIGKSTLLQRITNDTAEGITIGKDVRVGYYSQDFATLDYGQTAYACLEEVMEKKDEHILRATAAGFLLDGKALGNRISHLSEGQKGLLVFAHLVLMKPGLLLLDEPTNHINFRHLSTIAKAIDEFGGAVLIVSHIPDFVAQIRIDATIDLGKL
ncbi:hypothetical protein A3F28_03005 [Candidatus Uhrbacteria bacterium RIFCSPHIGHO2_12_FULL_57_11]|uniref:ABC transporter domain-containing protein n=3 Tax=Parcubacteria group TaxID=1794811 RepID=A0A1F7UIB0_9BACT|nr:MAG: hypothetical protein A2704_04725 [Candidatus Kaiserbacteria bacterium RIFCSPHIGHO2_01_FULL_54_36b]OGL73050.1 MAG: hypothetical protein A3D72_02410 [Candidatus Uhrbacteria bacterium RIFCSPHIGHO2_02_FULL_57_19]OGL78011.1 MAG: hypothetical protein A3F28_03005 [Candidatus Uhrbacteria bacterium RIFCSPHIGHO2_12_FULL_57_11]